MKGLLCILFSGLCFVNFTCGINFVCLNNDWNQINGHCYYPAPNDKRIQALAVQYCRNLDADLFVPRSDADITSFLRIPSFSALGPLVEFWIGVKYDSNLQKWVDGSGAQSMTFTPWSQSLNPSTALPCVKMRKNGQWVSSDCNGNTAFACVQRNPCLPNQCKSGICQPKTSPKFPNYKYTCECPPGYEGRTCTLIDDPCVKDPKAKCKNSGTCITKELPGKNDWFCLCPGAPKKGQSKDCSVVKSEETKRYENRQKVILAAAVVIPSGIIAIAWVVCCILECIEVGEVPDVDTASDSDTPTTSYATGTDDKATSCTAGIGVKGANNTDGKSESSKKTTKGSEKIGTGSASFHTNTTRNDSFPISNSTKSGDKEENGETDHHDQHFNDRYQRHVLIYKKLDQETLRALAEKDTVNNGSDSFDEV